MYILTIFLCVNVIFSCFKQLPTSFTLILLPTMLNPGGRLLSDVVGELIVLSDNSLDYHEEI